MFLLSFSASAGKRSRAQSAHKSHPNSRGTPSSGLFPPAIIWPNNRTITPDMGALNNEPSKKMQRPKTVSCFMCVSPLKFTSNKRNQYSLLNPYPAGTKSDLSLPPL